MKRGDNMELDDIIAEDTGEKVDLAMDSYLKGYENPFGLPPQRLKFAEAYFRTADMTQACEMAGYKTNATGRTAIKAPEVRLHIQLLYRLSLAQGKDAVADTQEVLEFLTSAMRGELFEPTPIGKGQGKQEVHYLPPKVSDRLKAGELLGKRYAIFDKDVSVTVNAPTFKGVDEIYE